MAPARLSLLQASARSSTAELAFRVDSDMVSRYTTTGDALLYTGAGAATSGLFLGAVALVSRWTSPSTPQGPKEQDALLGCASGDWEPPSAPEQAPITSGFAVASTLLWAVPSVLGTWCWPLLLVTAFGAGGSVGSDENREASHHFTLGADVVLLGAIVSYVAYKSFYSRHDYGFIKRFGPLVMITVGVLLMMLDPTRHVLLDHGGVWFKEEDLAMYDDYPHLSPIGRFCQVAAIAGIVLMMLGAFWFVDLPAKLAKCAS